MQIKSMMYFGIFAVAMAAVPAAAQTPAPAAPQVASATVDPMDEVVCKRESETGSLVKKKKKVCATRRQWEANAHKNRDALDQGQMSGSASGQ